MNKDKQKTEAIQFASSSLLTRSVRWLRKPSAERNRLLLNKIKNVTTIPFYFSKSHLLNVFLAYQPDSHVFFNNHPEFYPLWNSFTNHNKINNAGDITRLWSFILNLKQVMSENIEGDFAELGVWRGNTASVLAYYASKNNRQLYLFDTFEGFNSKDIVGIDANKPMEFSNTSVNMVKEVIGENSGVCHFVKGYFPESIDNEHRTKKFAVVSLDCDLYEPMRAGLEFFYPLMPKGGLFLLHDYSSLFWDGSKKAIDEFCQMNQEYVILMPDKSGSVFIRKSK